MQYLIAFCSQPEADTVVISGRFVRPVVPDKCVKLHNTCLNRSRDIIPEVIGGGIFDSLFRNNFQPEVVSDVISS